MPNKPKRDLALHLQPPIDGVDDSSDDGQLSAPTLRQSICRQGEQIAAEYLIAGGYTIMRRNWRSGRFTEVDLIAKDSGGVITFVEVKTRRFRRLTNGTALEGYEDGIDAVDWRKRRKMLIAARSFLSRLPVPDQGYSLDVIVVMYGQLSQGPNPVLQSVEVLHIPQAFNRV